MNLFLCRRTTSTTSRSAHSRPCRSVAADDREPTDLDLDDVIGKRIIETRLARSVTIREENAVTALEVMSRFAVDPRWLVYLPPTMAPTTTSDREGVLEHPHEAFATYRSAEVEQVVCEEKHMGSRAVVMVCRDSSVAARRFGIESSTAGQHLHEDRSAVLFGWGDRTSSPGQSPCALSSGPGCGANWRLTG